MKTIEQQAIFSIILVVMVSYLYNQLLGKINTFKIEGIKFISVLLYFSGKILGFLLLGLVPALLALVFFDSMPWQETIISSKSGNWWIWMLVASVLLIVFNLYNSKSHDLRTFYPELHLKQWTLGSLGIASAGWIIYLAGYEYLFRGILLSGCINAFGVWLAIVINLALYSSLHLYKGLKEAIAAIPFGAFLCYITIESQSVIPAILIHSLQAISCEIACIYRNNEMSFSFYKNKSL
jgi:membrane protease YdiL (CAAX protease family)